MKRLTIFVFIITFFFFCQKKVEDVPRNPISKTEMEKILLGAKKLKPEPVEPDEIAVIKTTMGTIKFKFFPDIAPGHCASFKMLANSGFYNGTTFHRVIPNFVIQGGDIFSRDNDPSNDGRGNPGYTLKAEFSGKNHTRGIISAARKSNDINSAGSQFFICVSDLPFLDGQYTIFGEVIEGMDVVGKIANAPRNENNDRPLKEIMMKSLKIVKEK